MAEIILPPEENEEIPQAPELNIDKPTENSKVITIEFEAKKTNKVSTKDTNQQLYTTDTDAWFEFKETSLEGANGTYSAVFRNRHDGSIFQRTGDVVNGVAYYKIPHQEIRHAGAWRGQIVYTLSNGDTTSREFDYDVKGHILDGKDVREIVVEDFETLMSQLRSMKDNAELELAGLVNTANQNETDRQDFFDDLVEDIDELQSNYQELLGTGVLQTNINTKLEQLEEEYAPKLTEVTAQLDQKVGGGVKAEPEDLSAETLGLVTGNSGPINLLSEPQNDSVNLDKLGFELKPVFEKTARNLYDPSLAVDNVYRNYSNGIYGDYETAASSGPIPVEPGLTYTFSLPESETRFENIFRCFDENMDPLGASRPMQAHPVVSTLTQDPLVIKNGRRQVTIYFHPETDVRFVETTLIYYAAHTTAVFDRVRNSFMVEEAEEFTSFMEYDPTGGVKIKESALPESRVDLSGLNAEIERLKKGNILYGKTLATVGTSITFGADMEPEGFDENGDRLTYGKQIADRNQMSFHNLGISGSTMQDIPTKNGFSGDRHKNMPKDIDYMTIGFGWNDTAYGELGAITDTDPAASYYGGWNTVMPYLIDNYPTTKIGLIVPFGTTAGHRQAVRNMAKKWGFAYLDLYAENMSLFYGKEDSVGVDPTTATKRRAVFQANGAHPGYEGHKFLSTMVEDFLRRL